MVVNIIVKRVNDRRWEFIGIDCNGISVVEKGVVSISLGCKVLRIDFYIGRDFYEQNFAVRRIEHPENLGVEYLEKFLRSFKEVTINKVIEL